MNRLFTPDGSVSAHIASAAERACLLEASAPKPGNVSPGRPFRDVSFDDFAASAAAIGPPLGRAGEQPLGITVLRAMDETRRRTPANTNLGIVLLFAPLAKAAAEAAPACAAVQLRKRLDDVLRDATTEDTRQVYAAIRAAAPGGLGQAPEQDVRDEPTMPLREAMRLAAHRDTIAREYVTTFETTFTLGAPALARARRDGLDWSDAIVEAFLEVLSKVPDTHIARRMGHAVAAEVSRQAADVVSRGGVRTREGCQAIDDLDASLRDTENSRNPGTTADLIAASLFVVLLTEGS